MEAQARTISVLLQVGFRAPPWLYPLTATTPVEDEGLARCTAYVFLKLGVADKYEQADTPLQRKEVDLYLTNALSECVKGKRDDFKKELGTYAQYEALYLEMKAQATILQAEIEALKAEQAVQEN